MFELELVKSVSVAEYDLTNFDEICRLFEDNNKGLKALGVRSFQAQRKSI